jgi:CheY-like chemotaxis protein/nitrogen-specific signal transduction histidine kinase
VTIDITSQEVAWLDADAARRQAEEANTQAQQSARAKDEFLATIGHELRAPLSAILGWAQLLRRQGEHTDVSLDEGLAVIERNARAQDRLVADLVDVALVSAGTVRMDVELVDLTAAARAAVDAARPAAQTKQIDLQLALDLTAGPVRGDPGRLQQVVANLLTNAVKFTPVGGQIRVTVARTADQVVLTVADTGEGIDPAFLPHVFDRFRQQDASTARRHGGLGLGLAIVRHLVELHHGRVRVESAGPGQGATFIVELPAAFPASSAAAGRRRPDRSIESDSSESARYAPPEPLHGVKVLVVDDDPDTLKAASGVLTSAGASVLTAESAPEAIAAVLANRPHVILCDIGMPEIDGYEFLRRLRTLPVESGGATPAAALTGFARPEDCLRVLTCGFQTHVPKPVEADELVQVVLRLSGGERTGKSIRTSGTGAP